MKKSGMRLLSLILCAAMLFGMLPPVRVSATEVAPESVSEAAPEEVSEVESAAEEKTEEAAQPEEKTDSEAAAPSEESAEPEEEKDAEVSVPSEEEAVPEKEPETQEPDQPEVTPGTEAAENAEAAEQLEAAPDALTAEEPEIFYAEETWINPLYKDIISGEDLVSLPQSEAAVAAAGEYSDSFEEVGRDMRAAMKNREGTIYLMLATASDDFDAVMDELRSVAFAHTGSPDEGDYIRWQYGGYNAEASYYNDGGIYYYTITVAATYYTTAAQEAVVDNRIDSLLAQWNVGAASDYVKVSTIYDYLCENVTYDYDSPSEDRLKHTAYAALINGTSVCQGYAVLFYRLALELGVDSRLISGDAGGPHGWNIAELGNRYYNLDSTWDAGRDTYSYFLRSPANFADHVRDSEYDTAEFHASYPMAAADYSASTETTEPTELEKLLAFLENPTETWHSVYNDVVIPAGQEVTLTIPSGYTLCFEGDVTVEPGAVLNLEDEGRFIVRNDLSVHGTLNNGAGNITMEMGGRLTVYGILNNNCYSDITVGGGQTEPIAEGQYSGYMYIINGVVNNYGILFVSENGAPVYDNVTYYQHGYLMLNADGKLNNYCQKGTGPNEGWVGISGNADFYGDVLVNGHFDIQGDVMVHSGSISGGTDSDAYENCNINVASTGNLNIDSSVDLSGMNMSSIYGNFTVGGEVIPELDKLLTFLENPSDSWYPIYNELVIPSGENVTLNIHSSGVFPQAGVTVEAGATLTIEGEGTFEINSGMTVEEGATLINNGYINVVQGCTLTINGTARNNDLIRAGSYMNSAKTDTYAGSLEINGLLDNYGVIQIVEEGTVLLNGETQKTGGYLKLGTNGDLNNYHYKEKTDGGWIGISGTADFYGDVLVRGWYGADGVVTFHSGSISGGLVNSDDFPYSKCGIGLGTAGSVTVKNGVDVSELGNGTIGLDVTPEISTATVVVENEDDHRVVSVNANVYDESEFPAAIAAINAAGLGGGGLQLVGDGTDFVLNNPFAAPDTISVNVFEHVTLTVVDDVTLSAPSFYAGYDSIANFNGTSSLHTSNITNHGKLNFNDSSTANVTFFYNEVPAVVTIASGASVTIGDLKNYGTINVANGAGFTYSNLLVAGTINYDGEITPSIMTQEDLVQAIADARNAGQTEYTLTQDLTLTNDLELDMTGFRLYVSGGTLTVPYGKTLTLKEDTYDSHLYIQDGALLNVAGTLNNEISVHIESGSKATVSGTFNNYDCLLTSQGYGDKPNGYIEISGTLNVGGGSLLGNIYNYGDMTITSGGSLMVTKGHNIQVNGNLTVEPGASLTMDRGTLEVAGELTVNGTLQNNTYLNVTSTGTVNIGSAATMNIGYTTVYGTANVAEGAALNGQFGVYEGASVDTVPVENLDMIFNPQNYDDLVNMVGIINAKGYTSAGLNVVDTEIVISDHLTIPKGSRLELSDSAVTVATGKILTIDGMLNIYTGSVVVDGSLVNNGAIGLPTNGDGSYGTLDLSNSESYSGEGILRVYTDADSWQQRLIVTDPENWTAAASGDGGQDMTYTAPADTGMNFTGNTVLSESIVTDPNNPTVVRIAKGATLTIPAGLNMTLNAGSLIVEGTLILEGEGNNRGALWLNNGCIAEVAEGGTIINHGWLHVGYAFQHQYFEQVTPYVGELIVNGTLKNYGYLNIPKGTLKGDPNVSQNGYVEINGTLDVNCREENETWGFVELWGTMKVSSGATLIVDAYEFGWNGGILVNPGGELTVETGADISGVVPGTISAYLWNGGHADGIPENMLHAVCNADSEDTIYHGQYHSQTINLTASMTLTEGFSTPPLTPTVVNIRKGVTVTIPAGKEMRLNNGFLFVEGTLVLAGDENARASLWLNNGCIAEVVTGGTITNYGNIHVGYAFDQSYDRDYVGTLIVNGVLNNYGYVNVSPDGMLDAANNVSQSGYLVLNGTLNVLSTDDMWGFVEINGDMVVNASAVWNINAGVNVNPTGSLVVAPGAAISLARYQHISVYDGAEVTGVPKAQLWLYVPVDSTEKLVPAIQRIQADYVSGMVGICGPVEITDSMCTDNAFTVPYQVSAEVIEGGALTVPEGKTLTFNNSLLAYGGSIHVNGTLVNNAYMCLRSVRDENGNITSHGALNVGENGKVTGSARVAVYTDDWTQWVSIPNADDWHAVQKTDYDGTSKYWELRYIKGLTQLATATDLKWDKRAEYVRDLETQAYNVQLKDAPGWIVFKRAELDQNEYLFTIYNEETGEVLRETYWSTGDDSYRWMSSNAFITADAPSGKYYFTVQTLGDGIQYYDSDVVRSETWEYTKPAGQLATCTDICWTEEDTDTGTTVKAKAVLPTNNLVGGVEFKMYFAKDADTPVTEANRIGWTTNPYASSGMTIYETLDDWLTQNNGNGYYYFRARALSADITQINNGPWSELSPAYHFVDTATEVNEKLDNILNDESLATVQEKIAAIKEIDNEDMKTAMLESDEVAEKVAALEAETDVTVKIDAENAPEGIQWDISVVGAALNVAEGAAEVSLVINDSENITIPEGYNQVIAVSFDLDMKNVVKDENGELASPVRISMPVPESVNPPESLVILHFKTETAAPEIVNYTLYYVDGKPYVKFAVSHFSPFAITVPEETAPETFNLSGTITSYGDAANSVTVNLLDAAGEVVDSVIVTGNSASYEIADVAAGAYTLTFSKANHVTRSYEVTITDGDVALDAVIWLLGDVTGDGIRNGQDATQINRYFNQKTSMLAAADENMEYRMKVADVTGDGVLNGQDATQINRYFNNKTSLLSK